MVFLLVGAQAIEGLHRTANHMENHISMIQEKEMSKAKVVETHEQSRSLRQAAKITKDDDKEADVADDDDDDDGDDEEDDAKEDAAEETEEKKEEQELEQAEEASLQAAKMKKADAQMHLTAYKDDRTFDTKIAAQVKLITNETQSETLSEFLGEMRTELREYSKPTYTAFLEEKVVVAEKKVADLEKELGKEPAPKPEEKVAAKEKVEKKEVVEKKPVEKTPPKKAPQDAEEESVQVVARKAGETFAISFFANVAFLAAVFAMASTENLKVRKNTWMLIDQVVLIFIAVMYFQAFDSFMDFSDLATHHHVIASILHAVIMLSMVLVLAYIFRGSNILLPILCGAGAHIVSFTSIHAAAGMQNRWWIKMSYSSLMCSFGIAVLAIGLIVIGYIMHTAKRRAGVLDDDDFMDKTDDVENDFGAMAFSVVFTMFVRFLITGHHPVDDETEFDHSAEQRLNMFLYACVCVIVAGFAVSYCTKQADEAARSGKYAKKRIMTFLSSVAAMNVAWAFLYWGEWTFFEEMFPGEAIKGRVMFAIVASVFAGLFILAISRFSRNQANEKTASASKIESVAVTAVGLVCAWSWELCFDAAVEDMVEGVGHPVAWKIASCLVMFSIIIPVYAFYIRAACERNSA
jgi:hypothetical protein